MITPDPGSGPDGPPAAAAVAADCLEQAPTALIACDGPELRIAVVNAAGRALLGHREPLLGVPAREALGESAGRQLVEVLERVGATGRPERAQEWRVCSDGNGDGAGDRWFTVAAGPWRRGDGTVRGVLAHVTEVTDTVLARREAQDRSRDAQQRYRAAHEVAVELQRVLLPQGLPVLPRVRVDARYCVAGEEQAAGGDWFDAITPDDGRLALVVGDVVGHGVTAAAVMGQLRAVLRQLLTSTPLPDGLRRLGGFARLLPDANGTTLAVAVLDPVTGALQYATCGHPPLLVVDETGGHRLLPVTGDGPLGSTGRDGGGPAATREDALAPGELLVLYSDGLIEREGRTLAEGLAELSRVAADAAAGRAPSQEAHPAAADRVGGITVEPLTRAGYADDVTVLVAQRLPDPVPVLHLDEPADPVAVRRIRRALDGWLAALDVDPGQTHDLQLAVGEAATNGVEHAYPAGTVAVTGRVDERGVLHLDVEDRGRWREPTPRADGRGRGLAMMRLLLDDVQVHPRPGGGTRVRLSQQLTRPVVLAVDAPPGPTPSRAGATRTAFSVRVGPESGLTVHVTGPIDTTGAGEVTAALLNASRGGTVALTADLTGVTLLASAGVQALLTVRDQFAAQDQDLRLLAPPGAQARQVLDLVGLAATGPPEGPATG